MKVETTGRGRGNLPVCLNGRAPRRTRTLQGIAMTWQCQQGDRFVPHDDEQKALAVTNKKRGFT